MTRTNRADRLPLLIRLAIRTGIFVIGWFVIGLASAFAKHFLVGGQHYDLLTEETLAVYRGGMNMLLILWFMGLIRSEGDA